ncbi:hypothetical protein BDC45DRAFT_535815 [Circinella umbellata]|nr:hypothetical protein BDC45DRAFT_535815 [Circinella umbellata]
MENVNNPNMSSLRKELNRICQGTRDMSKNNRFKRTVWGVEDHSACTTLATIKKVVNGLLGQKKAANMGAIHPSVAKVPIPRAIPDHINSCRWVDVIVNSALESKTLKKAKQKYARIVQQQSSPKTDSITCLRMHQQLSIPRHETDDPVSYFSNHLPRSKPKLVTA